MAFKKPTIQAAVPESPDRLFGDLPRRKHASLFDHQGQVLRNYVSHALNEKDVALQLPTGSGKTLVGLLLAEWRRRKFQERIVYLCPTRQLVNQVVYEASTKYGLHVQPFTGRVKDYTPEQKTAYADGERVAVTTYNSLFNINPFFKNPHIIIIDDAHAAENYMGSLWTMKIDRFEDDDATLYSAMASVIKKIISDKNYNRMIGDWSGQEDQNWVDKIPTYKFKEIAAELHAVINANIGESNHRYSWRMLEDHLHACQLYISSKEIMLRPLIPPTWSHTPFVNASQRIFMSATLGAGGDLERLTGRSKIKRLPIPSGWDRQGIGRRYFLFPEKSLTKEETLLLRRKLMQKGGRSLVLTPNSTTAKNVESDVDNELGFKIFSASGLENSKNDFITENQAVAVVANRYDGIDFPNDECRLLFVEGLSQTTNLQERFLISRMGANLLFNERIQTRVLQAIGRCTRGLNDYSAVVITGDELPTYLTDRRRIDYFHPELQAELIFGVEQSTHVSEQDLLDNFDIFLRHDEEWEEANQSILDSREIATQKRFPAMDQLEAVVASEIAWQTAMWHQDYEVAFDAARNVLGGLTDPNLRGYRALWHYLAGSSAEAATQSGMVHFASHARSQFSNAKSAANGIPWLIGLARGEVNSVTQNNTQDNSTLMLQVEQLEAQLAKLGTLHNRTFSARENEIREELRNGTTFEKAQVKLGEHLGFTAGKIESDASPDPWWIVGKIAIVFEDHANANETGCIDATKARQAASHIDWMKENVPDAANASIQSVLVTPVKYAKEGARPSLTRVSYWGLDEFREWAEAALVAIRDLRRDFLEPGDLDWRAKAADMLIEIKADAPGLYNWLQSRPANEYLEIQP